MRKIVTVKRCDWATFSNDPAMLQYHDTEWGVPVHRDRKLLEFLILEGAQAGLSWQTILKKRENYRRAFHWFDPAKMAKYNEKDVQRLLGDAGIVRNRLKIKATITNAQKFLDIQAEFGSFDNYVWRFVGGRPIKHGIKSLREIPATTKESDALSKDLRLRGFKFVGSTICYSFMQAVGMVNDHTTYCFKYRITGGTGRAQRNDS
jgi:DNA-3-methyladenine glycosylase I